MGLTRKFPVRHRRIGWIVECYRVSNANLATVQNGTGCPFTA